MIAELQKQGNRWTWIGFGIGAVAGLFLKEISQVLYVLTALAALLMFGYGCGKLAQAKGYHGAVGWLLSLTSLIGYGIIYYVLKDKTMGNLGTVAPSSGSHGTVSAGPHCAQCGAKNAHAARFCAGCGQSMTA